LRERILGLIHSLGLLASDRSPCGLPIPVSQAHALQVLEESDGITQNTLASCLHLDKGTTSRLVASLVERGWVVKERGNLDRREARLALSAAGRAALAEIRSASAARYGDLFADIPVDRRAQVLEALDILIAAVESRRQAAEG
jgi:DNA-binding MarR family transcriptional regulator